MNYYPYLKYIFFLLPVAWLLGLSQFILYLVLAIALLKLILTGRLKLNPQARDLYVPVLLLVASMVISGISVINAPPGRWLTYVRDLVTWFTGFCLLLTYSTDRQGVSMHVFKLTRLIVVFFFIINSVTIAAWLTDLRFHIETPITRFLPPFITGSDFGQSIFNIGLLRQKMTWLLGMFVLRSKAIFLYPNTYALALGVTLPLTISAYKRALTRKKNLPVVFYGIASVVALLALFSTVSRTGLLVTLIGAVVWCYLACFMRRSRAIRMFWSTVFTVFVVILMVIFVNYAIKLVEGIIYARGPGSAESRFAIYYYSVLKVFENPIGYGTQRDVPELLDLCDNIPPAGSHSQILGILFRYGFNGMAAYMVFLYRLFKMLLHGIRYSQKNRDSRLLNFYSLLTWAFFSTLLHQLVAEVVVDTLAFFTVFSLYLIIVLSGPEGHRQVSTVVRSGKGPIVSQKSEK